MATLEEIRRSAEESKKIRPGDPTKIREQARGGSLGEAGVMPETILTDPDIVGGRVRPVEEFGEFELQLNRFFAKPENQRIMLEALGGTAAAALAPEILVARAIAQFGPRIGQIFVRSLMAGGGEAAGSAVAETFDPSESPLASAGASFVAGITGEAAVPVAGKLLAPFSGALREGARETIRTAQRLGRVITPGTALDSRTIDLLENAAESSLFGGGRVQAVKTETRASFEGIVDRFSDAFRTTASKEEVGQLIQDVIDENVDAFRAVARGKYRAVDDLTQGLTVETLPIKALANRLLEKSERGLGAASIRRIANNILRREDRIPFEEMAELRSDLLGVTRQATDVVPGKAPAAAKILAKAADQAIVNSGKKLKNPAAIDAFREANAFWKQGKESFNSSLIRSLANKDPEIVFQTAIKANRPGTIRKVRQTILEPPGELKIPTKRAQEAWLGVQGHFIQDVMRKATNVDGEFSAKNAISQLKRFGDSSLKELFPGGEQKLFETALAQLRFVQLPPTSEGIGRIAIQLTQIGAAGALAAGEVGPLTVGLILGPVALARVFTNPIMAKWLTIGLKAMPGSQTAASAIAQLTAALAKEGLLENMETRENVP